VQPQLAASGAGVLGFAAYGERGGRVTTLQRALINAGITVRGGTDGIFGSGTAAAVIAFQRAKGLPASGVVDQATAEALALTPVSAPAAADVPSMTLQAFPVQGKCFFGDTWHVSRGSGRLHEGTDIGAAEGKYVYAAGDGRITKQYLVGTNQLTGNGLIVRTADGTYFFYAHLLDFAPGIGLGSPVKAGQIIGYVGKTGNSSVPHLHFEVHPRGGAAINPYPLLKAVNGCGTTTPPAQP
jgi:murein DD-endopeptidase MepM/ murein hydrolase activator NlpD